MNRRSFLKWQMQGLACLSASGLVSLARPALAQDLPDVAVVKGSPAAAARAAVELLGGMGRFVKPGFKVVIKPNMSFARGPESGANTHPEVVREVLVMCKEAGAGKVLVLDNPLQNAEKSLANSGILAACEGVEQGVCHQLSASRFFVDTEFSQGVDMRGNAVMRDVLEADAVIAVPVAKSHASAGVSMSLKGQMGLVESRRMMHVRYDLATAIVDIFTLIRPVLAVVDATRVLSTNGPGGPGLVLTPGEVIASADPVAADATGVASYEWYGRKIAPRQVAHIRIAHERGLGRMDIENLRTRRLEL